MTDKEKQEKEFQEGLLESISQIGNADWMIEAVIIAGGIVIHGIITS